jgi:Lar family restriction alleviation protein
MTDTIEVKPCPFCGGEARLDQRVTQSLWNSNDAVFSHVDCDECDISGQDFCDDPDGEEAIEWWNRRAQPASVPDEVRRDARRLDWLEKMAADDWGLMLHNGSVRGDGMRGLGLLGRDLRSAIDTAMRGNPQA